jgi:AcrR family transcriptional regulator
MNYAEFQQLVEDRKLRIFRETFARNPGAIRIKKEKTVVKNLGRIFDATLAIGNQKGFQAMSMRDLAHETGLSTGALYAYFSSKDELLAMLQSYGRSIAEGILEEFLSKESEPVGQLRTMIKTHLYLSEAMQPWFYFSYMEAKNLSGAEREKAVASELRTEKVLADILAEGEAAGVFRARDHLLAASVIKAMLQDWYLKRGKYARRNITVDGYAEFLFDFINAFHLIPVRGRRSNTPRSTMGDARRGR